MMKKMMTMRIYKTEEKSGEDHKSDDGQGAADVGGNGIELGFMR